MAFSGEEKWCVEHFGDGGAHVANEKRKSGEDERGDRQRHVEREIANFVERGKRCEIHGSHAARGKPARSYGEHEETESQR